MNKKFMYQVGNNKKVFVHVVGIIEESVIKNVW